MRLTTYSALSFDDFCTLVESRDSLTDIEVELYNRTQVLLALLEQIGIEVQYSVREDDQGSH